MMMKHVEKRQKKTRKKKRRKKKKRKKKIEGIEDTGQQILVL
jgi:hypothetical protein